MAGKRPNPPTNVIPLSPYRARLGRGRRLRRADALLEAPDLQAAVRALPGDELYYVLHEIGLGEGSEILYCATAEQLAVALDFALWDRDQLAPGALAEWLHALSGAPFEQIGHWLTGLDSELVGLILRRGARIYDVSQEGPPEEPEGSFYPTPDGLFVLDVLGDDGQDANPEGGGADQRRSFMRLVDGLYRADKDAARRILVGARSELDAELEETAYRWRQARMADLGFADYHEALEVYRELDPASVRLGAADSGSPPLRTAIDTHADARSNEASALRVPTALAERLSDGSGSPFSRAAQRLTGGDLDELRFSLVALTNRVLAADRVAPGDDEAVGATLDRLVSTLDLGIELLSRGDDERGSEALRTIPLQRLFRLGVTLVGKVKRLAMALRRNGPFGARGLALAEPDDAVALEAFTRLRPMFPRSLDEPPTSGERPFRSLGDLVRATAAVETAAAAQAIVRGLGVSPDDVQPGAAALAGTGIDEAALDLGVLARTVLVRHLLEPRRRRGVAPAGLEPLEPDEVRGFEAKLQTSRAGAPSLPADWKARVEARLTEAAPATLAPGTIATVAARWLASLAPLEPTLMRAAAAERRSPSKKRR